MQTQAVNCLLLTYIILVAYTRVTPLASAKRSEHLLNAIMHAPTNLRTILPTNESHTAALTRPLLLPLLPLLPLFGVRLVLLRLLDVHLVLLVLLRLLGDLLDLVRLPLSLLPLERLFGALFLVEELLLLRLPPRLGVILLLV